MHFNEIHALLFANMKHLVLFALGCCILAAGGWLAWAIHRDSQLAQGFDRIKTGDNKSDIFARLGKPRRVERCGAFFGPLPEDLPVGCDSEYVYASPFATLNPQYYVVRFAAGGHVLETVPLSSP
jgi:hypothetical protein